MNRFLLRVVSSMMILTALPAAAAVTVTGFSSTNTSAGGIGDVTITFETDEANFGPANGGGFAVSATLPAGMSTGGAYTAEAPCSPTTMELTTVSGFTPYCFESSGRYFVANQASLGIRQVIGAGSYTFTITNVTNPNSAGPITLSEFSVWDSTSGAPVPVGGAPEVNLSAFRITITSVATPVPTLPWFGLGILASLLGFFSLRRIVKAI